MRELIKLVKENFEVMPTRTEFKQFIDKHDIDLRLTVDETLNKMVDAYNRKENRKIQIPKEKIQELRDKGYKFDTIAKKLHISSTKLYQLIEEYNLPKIRYYIDRDKVRLLLKGNSQKKVAEILGCHYKTICEIAGEFRNNNEPVVDHRYKTKDIKRETIRDLMEQGNNYIQIAQILGISTASLRNVRKRFDILDSVQGKKRG